MTRSTSAADYQDVPRAVAVMAKTFPAGGETGLHSHPRAQLLHATAGLMVATLAEGAWIVPEGYALWIPPGVQHNVAMHGVVSMMTAYVAVEVLGATRLGTKVITVSPLLKAALAALAEEPVLYDEEGRGGHLASLLVDEILRSPETAMTLPLPRDGRLRRACLALIEKPSLDLVLDDWAEAAGVSRRTLTRRFRDETAMSFGQWRARARVIRAFALMADGKPAQQTASLVGYRSLQALRGQMGAVIGEGKSNV